MEMPNCRTQTHTYVGVCVGCFGRDLSRAKTWRYLCGNDLHGAFRAARPSAGRRPGQAFQPGEIDSLTAEPIAEAPFFACKTT